MSPQVVAYRIDKETIAQFEIDPLDGFAPAGFGEVVGRIASAADPAIQAARVVLNRVRSLSPDGVEVKFGIKVTGTANWVVARAATDASFEVSLSWKPTRTGDEPAGPTDPG